VNNRIRVVMYEVIKTGHRFSTKDIVPATVSFHDARMNAYRQVMKNNQRFDTTPLKIVRFSIYTEAEK